MSWFTVAEEADVERIPEIVSECPEIELIHLLRLETYPSGAASSPMDWRAAKGVGIPSGKRDHSGRYRMETLWAFDVVVIDFALAGGDAGGEFSSGGEVDSCTAMEV